MTVNYKRVKAYGIVEFMLRNQKEIEFAVYERRHGKMSHGKTGGSGKAFISDPTAKEAIDNVTPLPAVELPNGSVVREPEKWIKVMHFVYGAMDPIERKIMQMFYSGKSVIAVSIECHVDESTVYRVRGEYRHRATEAACQEGLVKVM